jgi:hypothetical protein
MRDEPEIERLRERLKDKMRSPPQRIINGSIQATRAWVDARKRAEKILNKSNATSTQLLSAISSLE